MAERRCDVLIFVEDPGAANFVAALPESLAGRRIATHLAACGPAVPWLRQRALPVDEVPDASDANTLLAAVAPRVLVVGTAENRRSLGLMLTEAARRDRVPSIGVLDASTHLDFRFRGLGTDPLAFCPDVVLVPDGLGAAELARLGLDPRRVVVAGHPHWDHVRATGRQLQGMDRTAMRRRLFGAAGDARKVVVFAAELSEGMNRAEFRRSAAYTLEGSGAGDGRTEIVLDEVLAAIEPYRRDLFLVLRLHPKQGRDDLALYRPSFDQVSQAGSALELIHAADAVVGMTSMLMVEAALLERPTLSVVPRAAERAWLPTAAAGIVPTAWTSDALRREMLRLLEGRSPCLAQELELLFPSGAMEIVVRTIERLLMPQSGG